MHGRGLDDLTIDTNKYASLLPLRWDWEPIFEDNGLSRDSWHGVPGFSESSVNGERIVWFALNLMQLDKQFVLIPCRGVQGRIFGMQGRNMDPHAETRYLWASSAHTNSGTDFKQQAGVSLPAAVKQALASQNQPLQSTSVWLTEGGLKSDITAKYFETIFANGGAGRDYVSKAGFDVMSVAGVSSYRRFLDAFKQMNVTQVVVAFDADYVDNQAVARSMSRLIDMLKEAGYPVYRAVRSENAARPRKLTIC